MKASFILVSKLLKISMALSHNFASDRFSTLVQQVLCKTLCDLVIGIFGSLKSSLIMTQSPFELPNEYSSAIPYIAKW